MRSVSFVNAISLRRPRESTVELNVTNDSRNPTREPSNVVLRSNGAIELGIGGRALEENIWLVLKDERCIGRRAVLCMNSKDGRVEEGKNGDISSLSDGK